MTLINEHNAEEYQNRENEIRREEVEESQDIPLSQFEGGEHTGEREEIAENTVRANKEDTGNKRGKNGTAALRYAGFTDKGHASLERSAGTHTRGSARNT